MITVTNERPTHSETPLTADHASSYYPEEAIIDEHTLTKASADTTHQLFLSRKFVAHPPKAGLNPLVDAAAYLFSIMGKLKRVKTYRNLETLHHELIQAINVFQEVAQSHSYNADYVLLARYALCTTLDDIISNTTWGSQGQWQAHSLLNMFSHGVFNQEPVNQERFFIILGRLIKEPALYIDVLEFMYICLSLGFKGSYRSTEYNKTQLEQITHSLYKHIRAYRGDFSKTLSPFSITPPTTDIATPTTKSQKKNIWITAALTTGIFLALFLGARYMLDSASSQAYQDLTKTGKSAPL